MFNIHITVNGIIIFDLSPGLIIEENIQNILPETSENDNNAWVQKLQLCVTNNGGHFKNLLIKCNELFSISCIKIFVFKIINQD